MGVTILETMQLLKTTTKMAKSVFKGDERAVSPVIGVILMVAITVILAAVIGTFVLDLGQSVGGGSAPSASFQFEQTGGSVNDTGTQTLKVVHAGGATLDSDNIEIRVGGSSEGYSQFSNDVSAGSSATLAVSDESPDTMVTVVWVSPSTDKTAILASYTLA